MTIRTASPTKLRNGNWGARVQSTNVAAGDTVTITTRNGKSWEATVIRVLWTGNGVAVCATESGPPSPRRSYRMGSGHGRAAQVTGYSSYCTDNEYCGCYDCAS